MEKKEYFAKLCKRDGYQCSTCRSKGDKVKLFISSKKSSNSIDDMKLLCSSCYQPTKRTDSGNKLFEIAFEKAGINIKGK